MGSSVLSLPAKRWLDPFKNTASTQPEGTTRLRFFCSGTTP